MQTTSFEPTASSMTDKATTGIDRISSGAHEAVDRVAQAAATAAEQLGQRSVQLRARQAELTDAARECVRRHPLASIGIAVGIGLLLSLINGRANTTTH